MKKLDHTILMTFSVATTKFARKNPNIANFSIVGKGM